jgi:hypothetical protein
VPISGWKKQAKSGLNYISAVGQPPRDWVDPGDSAQKLAQAFDGQVVEVDGDMF